MTSILSLMRISVVLNCCQFFNDTRLLTGTRRYCCPYIDAAVDCHDECYSRAEGIFSIYTVMVCKCAYIFMDIDIHALYIYIYIYKYLSVCVSMCM